MTIMTATKKITKTAADVIASRDYIASHVIPCLRPADVADDALTIPFLDLTLYYRIPVIINGDEGTYVLSRDLAAAHSLDVEELTALAVRNVCDSVECVPLSSVLGLPAGDEDFLYVVRTRDGAGMYSAGAAMLCTYQLHRLCERLGCARLTLIPSSVHEILALPRTDGIDSTAIDQMIVSVNSDPALLARSEILSDHAYIYDYTTDSVTC